jgi:hypothetical protein
MKSITTTEMRDEINNLIERVANALILYFNYIGTEKEFANNYSFSDTYVSFFDEQTGIYYDVENEYFADPEAYIEKQKKLKAEEEFRAKEFRRLSYLKLKEEFEN